MRFSWRKAPALYGLVFLFAFAVEAVMIFLINMSVFSWQEFIATYWALAAKTFFIGIIGGLLHILSYLISLPYPWVLAGNLVGLAGYIVMFILPNLFWLGLILLVISIRLIMHNSPHHTPAIHQAGPIGREGNA